METSQRTKVYTSGETRTVAVLPEGGRCSESKGVRERKRERERGEREIEREQEQEPELQRELES